MRFPSRNAAQTRALARLLGEAIVAGKTLEDEALVIGLIGPLGAGKTEFVRGLAEGLGVDAGLVASPTFVLASEYPAAGIRCRRLAHVDLYRIESETELEDAGFLDLLTSGTVVAVEWADRLADALPEQRVEVRLERRGDEERELDVEPRGTAAKALAEEWQRRVDAWR